jgi:hypothetical protein
VGLQHDEIVESPTGRRGISGYCDDRDVIVGAQRRMGGAERDGDCSLPERQAGGECGTMAHESRLDDQVADVKGCGGSASDHRCDRGAGSWRYEGTWNRTYRQVGWCDNGTNRDVVSHDNGQDTRTPATTFVFGPHHDRACRHHRDERDDT